MSFRANHKVFHGSSGKESIRLVMLGGSGNVTKNMFVYELRYDDKLRDILIVDCGIGFPDSEMYGVDLVLPDIRYLEDKKDKIRGLVFTHGHDDHIGAIPYIATQIGKIPMYATTLTAAFANIKLKEAKIRNPVKSVNFDQELRIGPFGVQFIRVTHSIPDAANIVINTPVGNIYHGSDFKFDFSPLDGKLSELEKINRIGEKGVLLMLTDCLGSERPGFTPSEQVVAETLRKELKLCTGKCLFTTQSSNISRIQLAIDIALESDRKIAFFGRSMDQNIEESLKLGYMNFPRDAVIKDRDLKKLPPSKQFLIVAGSQGQSDSALSRIANNEHRFVRIEEGDTVVFSADPIPGNEANVDTVIEQLYRQGARLSYSNIMDNLHVSGHGSQGDLMLMLSAVNPRYVLPIGGTYKHIMQYRRLTEDLGYDKKNILIPESGQVYEFKNWERPRVVENIELENVMIDGLGIGDVGNIVLHDRRTIAKEGIVVVIIPTEERTGRLASDPDIVSRGFIYMKDSISLVNRAKRVVIESLNMKKGMVINWQSVKKQVETNLLRFFRKETGRSPLIVPVIIEI